MHLVSSDAACLVMRRAQVRGARAQRGKKPAPPWGSLGARCLRHRTAALHAVWGALPQRGAKPVVLSGSLGAGCVSRGRGIPAPAHRGNDGGASHPVLTPVTPVHTPRQGLPVLRPFPTASTTNQPRTWVLISSLVPCPHPSRTHNQHVPGCPSSLPEHEARWPHPPCPPHHLHTQPQRAWVLLQLGLEPLQQRQPVRRRPCKARHHRVAQPPQLLGVGLGHDAAHRHLIGRAPAAKEQTASCRKEDKALTTL